uniref:TNF alpha induced protein 2 n=1 Tax=Homo sapiens TaxID=9606 RepID=H0YKY9_HUMAN
MSEASSEDLVPPLEAGAAPYREEEEAAKKKKEKKKKSPRASFCTWAAP